MRVQVDAHHLGRRPVRRPQGVDPASVGRDLQVGERRVVAGHSGDLVLGQVEHEHRASSRLVGGEHEAAAVGHQGVEEDHVAGGGGGGALADALEEQIKGLKASNEYLEKQAFELADTNAKLNVHLIQIEAAVAGTAKESKKIQKIAISAVFVALIPLAIEILRIVF